ncbi:hypothetical protein B0J14DRAFT_617053 [Halenospora varia]|nr:hypothetical protein B0J14DRAFT_617053 [Halenospora varia]
MKTQTQVFDPDGDLTFILTHHPSDSIESRDFTPELGIGFDLNLDSKEPDEEHEVRIQVSSKHLTLASPVFKAMLKHSFREGAGLREFGCVQIPLPEDDPDAFSILMSIIHAKNQAVPRQMSLPLLTTIAILVDKYELHESTDLFANTWIDALKTSMPETFCKQLISWICITWVFRRPAEFTWASFVAIKQSTGVGFETVYEDFDTLPIPEEIIEAINVQREQAMEKILECLRMVVHGIQESKSHNCPAHRQECEALLLGTLLRSASKSKLWPIMESPYPGLSFKEVAYGIGALYIKSFCSQERGVYSATADDSHGIKTTLKAELKEIEMHLRGLRLKDFENTEL